MTSNIEKMRANPLVAYNGWEFEPAATKYRIRLSPDMLWTIRAYEDEVGETLLHRLTTRSEARDVSYFTDYSGQAQVSFTLSMEQDTTEMRDHIAHLISTHHSRCLEAFHLAKAQEDGDDAEQHRLKAELLRDSLRAGRV